MRLPTADDITTTFGPSKLTKVRVFTELAWHSLFIRTLLNVDIVMPDGSGNSRIAAADVAVSRPQALPPVRYLAFASATTSSAIR